MKRVGEKDVAASLVKLRDLLQADVGVAARMLKAVVGDVVIEKWQIEGQEKPLVMARFHDQRRSRRGGARPRRGHR